MTAAQVGPAPPFVCPRLGLDHESALPATLHHRRRPARALVQATIALAIALCASPSASATSLELTGPARIPVDEVAAQLEPVPDGVDARYWADIVKARLLAYYLVRGFDEVRVETLYDPARDRLRVWVDEGRMAHIVFSGVSLIDALLYRVDINLPGDVYHRPTVRAIAAELRQKYDLDEVHTWVTELDALEQTPLGTWLPRRELTFEIRRPESTGWGFGFSLDGNWGFIPRVRLKTRDLFLDEDRLRAQLGIGLPYRRFLTQQGAELQWTYGRLELDYRFPRLVGRLAPSLDADVEFARHARNDIDIQDYFGLRVQGLASIDVLFDQIELSLGGGISYSALYDAGDIEREIDDDAVRGVVNLGLEVFPWDQARREDERLFVKLDARLSGNADDGPQYGLFLHGQATSRVEPLRFIARLRGFWLAGDVRFWEEIPLSGSYLKAFFGRYAREAVQLDTQMRFIVSSVFELGIFYDLTGFIDRSVRDELTAGDTWPFEPAQAVGPSLHVLVFDAILFDVAYAFGFDPDGFDHNVYLSATSVF